LLGFVATQPNLQDRLLYQEWNFQALTGMVVEMSMENLQRQPKSKRSLLVFAVAAGFFLLAAGQGEAAGNETRESRKVTSPPPTSAIPVAEVATRATEVTNLLGTLKTQLAPSSAIEAIRSQLAKVSAHIDLLLEGIREILQEQPPLATLQTQQQIWEGMQRQGTNWLKVLTERAVQLRTALDRVADLQETWTKTEDAAKTAKAPEPILQQIGAVLEAINTVQPPLQAQRGDVLDLQSRVAEAVGRCQNVLEQIALAQKQAMGGILVRGEMPIWSPVLWQRMQTRLLPGFRGIAGNCWDDIQQYLSNPSMGMPLHAGIFIMLTLLLCAARRRVGRWREAGDPVPSAAAVFDFPYAAALIGSAIVATGPVSPTPQTVKFLFGIAAIVPIIRLALPVVDRRVIPGLYALAILFIIDIVRRTFEVLPLIGQVLLLLEAAAGSLIIGWYLTIGHLRRATLQDQGLIRLQALRMTAILGLFILAAALLAGVVGYMRLARLLVSEILGGGTLALGFYAFYRVATGVVALALRVWPLRLLQMVQHHGGLLEERAHRMLVWLGIGAWVVRWLSGQGLLLPALSFGEAALAMNLERGSFNLSLGDVLAFVLTVWVAYLLSAFIRFVLHEDVYPRMRIAPGLSYAISRLLHYVILALGLVVGMGLMGVDLSRLTVLAGAFGVGIGFGLQSVVNNFVCGLILLFERPIHVGDMIEVGDLLGEVRRIGIRASTVRTRQGADIIVPNAQLVTDKVTNWTLSDKLRRIALPVGVNYGASPKKVIEILEAVALTTPRVLQKPEPRALFMSYGDSSINFELRAWTDESIYWRQVLSNLAVAVYDAVLEAGMTFPFPQRDVHLLKEPAPPKE